MKKKLLMLLTLMFFTPFAVNAYEVKMDWQKSYDIEGKPYFTKDGGIIVLSENYDSIQDDFDCIITKYDKDGNVLWQKNWGGNNYDAFRTMLLTEDDGVIVYVDSSSTDIEGITNLGGSDNVLIKYDKHGNVLWQKNWGGNQQDDFFSMLVTEDGGFIAVGYTNSTDIEGLPNKGEYVPVIVKFDKNGNVLWQKNWYGFGSFDSVEQTGDGGFIAIGSSTLNDIEGLTNKGEYDAIIVKYDKDGNVLWQKNWGGNRDDVFRTILLTEDRDFIAYGISSSNDIEGLSNKGESDAIIVKYDKDGNMLWQKSWAGNNVDWINSPLLIDDGGFILFGSSNSINIEGIINHGSFDTIIARYDKDGNMLWQKSWGGNDEDWIHSSLLIDDGGFILFGSSNSTNIEGMMNHGSFDAVIARYDKDGNMLWQKNWGGSENDGFISMSLTEDGGFIGICESFNLEQTNFDIKIIKYSIEYELENGTNENGTSIVQQQGKYGVITPTPNEGYEVDKIIIKDKDGNVLDVEVTKQEDGTYLFDLYTDVSVEVLYKEKIENPKTGILDVMTILIIGFIISVIGIFTVKLYNERYEI